MDNTHKFDGLADIYAASRPDYPADALRAIAADVTGRGLPAIALDVGAGTGISTRALAVVLPAWQVIAVEPNADMAETARAACAGLAGIRVVNAAAEALPVEDARCGLIIVAQALHWFDRSRFFAEAARVLAPGGLLAILNNNRRTADSAVLSAIEDLIERECPGYSRFYRTFDIAAEVRVAPGLTEVQEAAYPWRRKVTAESLTDYFLSRSSAPPIVAKHGAQGARDLIREIVLRHEGQGPFEIPIDCDVVTARRV